MIATIASTVLAHRSSRGVEVSLDRETGEEHSQNPGFPPPMSAWRDKTARARQLLSRHADETAPVRYILNHGINI